jgi:hypothetical protein
MKKAQMISPDAYPQMVSKGQAKLLSQSLRSAITEVKANRVIEDSAEGLREAVLAYVKELEHAGGNMTVVSDKAHEIKGFADTAGLPATARIAEGLCRYMEESDVLKAAPDAAVVALYVSAVGRSTRNTGAEAQASSTVASELAALAAHKLAEVKPR